LYDTDLYKLQDDRASAVVAKNVVDDFERRREVADAYNTRLLRGEVSPGLRSVWWRITGKRAQKEKEWREKTGKKRPSLVFAMNYSVKWWFWSGGLCRLYSDTAQVTSPLIVKVVSIAIHILLTADYETKCRRSSNSHRIPTKHTELIPRYLLLH
jgi:hypothetical protein